MNTAAEASSPPPAALARRFRHRRDAGRLLAARLASYAGREDVVVIALPRGGVPVAYEVARSLQAPLDVLAVRRLAVDRPRRLSVGAIASGGEPVFDEAMIRSQRVPQSEIRAAVDRQRRLLALRERRYRRGQPAVALGGRVVILVDDGFATGSTVKAAASALRNLSAPPARIVAAAPVAAPEARRELPGTIDELVCVIAPFFFVGVKGCYEDFAQVKDAEVLELLALHARQRRRR